MEKEIALAALSQALRQRASFQYNSRGGVQFEALMMSDASWIFPKMHRKACSFI